MARLSNFVTANKHIETVKVWNGCNSDQIIKPLLYGHVIMLFICVYNLNNYFQICLLILNLIIISLLFDILIINKSKQ